jgi:TPR repeat protein
MRKKISRLAVLCVCGGLSFSSYAMARTTADIARIFDAGIAAYDAGQYADAYKLWDSIEDEDVAAMRNLGILYRKGLGVKKDPGRAEEMFERAADAGLATAQADLADMLLKGEAGKPDPKRALPLLKAAAAANHPVAQYELAQLYEAGGLVPRDVDMARELYAQAARHGMKQAGDRLAVLGPPDKRLARKASLTSNVTSSVNLLDSLGGSAPAFPSLGGGGAGSDDAYFVQIGAFQDRAQAEAARDKLKAKVADLLAGRGIDVQSADLKDKGTWYRLRVAGFKDASVASAFCQTMVSDRRVKCFSARDTRAATTLAQAPAANNP